MLFTELPDEVIQEIGRFCTLPDLNRLLRSSKSVYNILNDDSMWIMLLGRDYDVDYEMCETEDAAKDVFVQHYCGVKDITWITGNSINGARFDAINLFPRFELPLNVKQVFAPAHEHSKHSAGLLQDLKKCRCTVVYSNYLFPQRKEIGDALADYVDAGGAVVVMVFSTTTRLGLAGSRWEAEGYLPMAEGGEGTTRWQGVSLQVPNHPIFEGLDWSRLVLKSGYRASTKDVRPDAQLLAKWKASGEVLVATQQKGLGHVVAINAYPEDGNSTAESSEQMCKLIANACQFAARSSKCQFLSTTRQEAAARFSTTAWLKPKLELFDQT